MSLGREEGLFVEMIILFYSLTWVLVIQPGQLFHFVIIHSFMICVLSGMCVISQFKVLKMLISTMLH